MFRLDSNSNKETINYGKVFSQILNAGDIVVLEGDLGGGKTTFIKGILKGLNFKKRVLSPSFTLVRHYNTRRFTIYHLDLYRIQRGDLLNLGVQESFYSPKTLVLIEWGDKIKDNLSSYIQVKFLLSGKNKRKLIFSLKGYDKVKFNSIEELFKDEFIRN